MFPTIPEDLNALSGTELRALSREIKAGALTAMADPALSSEDYATWAGLLAQRPALTAKAAEQDAKAATLAALSTDDSDEEPEVTPEPEVAAADESDDEGDEPEGAAGTVVTTFGTPSAPTTPKGGTALAARPKATRITAEVLLAADSVPGKDAGEGFGSWAEFAHACVERSKNIRKNTDELVRVGVIEADYPVERIMTDDKNFNMSRFEPDELTAALCAPATPYYGLACANTLRRPVFNSMPQFQAPRGKVSIPTSPTLSDITTGVGIWSAANEASTNAVKSACQTISCGSSTEFQIYGVYRCLTVRNLLAMTYPELVEAWLNRLGAAHARLAEQNLLNAMGTAATTINGQALGYGASTTITSTILNYIALYQETQRWDITENMEAWLPRWVMYGMKMDMMRRRSTSGDYRGVPTDAAINAMLTNAGVNPHWFIDTPTWATAIPAVATSSNLNRLPANVQILLAPPGKLAVMDRGELAIGVTGNGIYRDNNSNSRNEFTFFFENFEGVVNTTSCPAHIIDIPVCWNGVQIDDIVMNCQGGDEVGFQS